MLSQPFADSMTRYKNENHPRPIIADKNETHPRPIIVERFRWLSCLARNLWFQGQNPKRFGVAKDP